MRNKRRSQINRHCRASIDSYRKLGHCEDTADGPLIHIQNGGKILGVAHLDAVAWDKPRWNNGKVYCRQLDDRLGVWVLLDLLPTLGCPAFDVLLTDSEECGRSTAQYFEGAGYEYNWIFEFDRAGSDCVLYDYENDATTALVESYGWPVETGMFSDICSLEHLGIKGFNFGTGYHGQHTTKCYADIAETVRNAKRFVAMANDYRLTPLPHTPTPSTYGSWWNDDTCDICPECMNEFEDQWTYCPWCGVKMGDTYPIPYEEVHCDGRDHAAY